MVRSVTNTHIAMEETSRMPQPAVVKGTAAASARIHEQVIAQRREIEGILSGNDNRLLAIVGPCSIHSREAAEKYAENLAPLARKVNEHVLVVMRCYFAKPRSVIGWKGFFHDPDLTGTEDIQNGARRMREIALSITEHGLPIGTEVLDQFMVQYIDDLVSWSCIGARTVESQLHREVASGLSMPVGFKNATTGDTKSAVDAVEAATHPHHFWGMDQGGCVARFKSTGNPFAHIVLRGGNSEPNYDQQTVAFTVAELAKRQLPRHMIVDCSHGNSGKNPRKQRDALGYVLEARLSGNWHYAGIMLESHLEAGAQPFPTTQEERDTLRHTQSITDKCIGWDETEELIHTLAAKLS